MSMTSSLFCTDPQPELDHRHVSFTKDEIMGWINIEQLKLTTEKIVTYPISKYELLATNTIIFKFCE